MSEGIITINSDEIDTIVNVLTTSYINLNDNVLNKLTTKFSVLDDLGIYNDGKNSTISQTNAIIDIHKNLISQIKQHLEEYVNTEDTLSNNINASLNGNNYNYNSSNGVNTNSIDDISISDVNQGKSLSTTKLLSAIEQLTDEEKIKLIEILNINKGNDTLSSLLLDTTKSAELYILLQKILGISISELNLISIDDCSLIQKSFLNAILKKDIDITQFSSNTIFIIKDYLLAISEENKISIGDLLLNKEYNSILKLSLVNLYYNNNIEKYNLTTDNINLFKNYVDNIAQSNNVSSANILFNKIELII